MDALQDVALIAATVFTGLLAGLFAGFSYAVMPGLRRADDATFTAAMRHINDAILNPLFLCLFLGSWILPWAPVALYREDGAVLPWAVAGAACSMATFVVTTSFNVPLNNALKAGGTREAFEARWNRFNTVRTLTGTAAFVCLAVALTRS